MARQPVPGTKTLRIRSCGGPRPRLERKAVLELRAATVELVLPKDRDDRTPTPMLAVSVRERRPPPDREPLHGVLRTTEGGPDLEHARRIVAGYEARWTLEEYFRVLKVGTRIENRRLDDADDLRKTLAFEAGTAGRIMNLERLARDRPNQPALDLFTNRELEILPTVSRTSAICCRVRRRSEKVVDFRSTIHWSMGDSRIHDSKTSYESAGAC